MAESGLIELSYYDPKAQMWLVAYADTIILDHNEKGGVISAIRFGGYPEVVRALSDAIYGGATIDATQNNAAYRLQSNLRGCQRQFSHDGIYAAATLMAADDKQSANAADPDEEASEDEGQQTAQPCKCYIFCPAGDRDRLFEELDRKTAAPFIPAFRDYVLEELEKRGHLRRLQVFSLMEKMDAWVLALRPDDENVVRVLEDGLKSGRIAIPGTVPGVPDGFENVENVTGYLNTFGVTVADRIRNQFMPLFNPASEPLSKEVLAVKRQLDRKRVALIIAECGSGKSVTRS